MLLLSLFAAISLTACSSSSVDSMMTDSVASYDTLGGAYEANGFGSDYGYSFDEDAKEESYEKDEIDEDEINKDDITKPQKLVYTANVEIDTLNFDESCNSLFVAVDEAGGFIENKSIYDDGGDRYYYDYDDDASKSALRHTMSATVRIPSEKYDEFMSKTSSLGNIRNSTENVENMTRQYGTLQSQLEIYETEYQNYMEMLSTAESDEAKIQIKNELTDIAVQIADIKNSMSYIDVDVDYSKITVCIREVSKYTVVKEESTFWARLADTFETSIDEFGEFLENVLFAIILNWYKWLFTIFVFWIICKVIRLFIKKSDAKKNKKKMKKVNTEHIAASLTPGEETSNADVKPIVPTSPNQEENVSEDINE